MGKVLNHLQAIANGMTVEEAEADIGATCSWLNEAKDKGINDVEEVLALLGRDELHAACLKTNTMGVYLETMFWLEESGVEDAAVTFDMGMFPENGSGPVDRMV